MIVYSCTDTSIDTHASRDMNVGLDGIVFRFRREAVSTASTLSTAIPSIAASPGTILASGSTQGRLPCM